MSDIGRRTVEWTQPARRRPLPTQRRPERRTYPFRRHRCRTSLLRKRSARPGCRSGPRKPRFSPSALTPERAHPAALPGGEALTGALLLLGMAVSWKQAARKIAAAVLKLHPVYRVAVEAWEEAEKEKAANRIPELPPYRAGEIPSWDGGRGVAMLRRYLDKTGSRFPDYRGAVLSEMERNKLLDPRIVTHLNQVERRGLVVSMVDFALTYAGEFRTRAETKRLLLVLPRLPLTILRSLGAPMTIAAPRDPDQKAVTDVALRKLDVLAVAKKWNEDLDGEEREKNRDKIVIGLTTVIDEIPDESHGSAADYVRVMAYQHILSYFFVYPETDVGNLAAVRTYVDDYANDASHPLHVEALHVRGLIGVPRDGESEDDFLRSPRFRDGLEALRAELVKPAYAQEAVFRIKGLTPREK